MPIVSNKQYHSWMEIAANMELYSDTSMLRITYEGLTNYQYLINFDRDSIKSISKACNKDIDRNIADVPNGIALPKTPYRGQTSARFQPADLLLLRLL